MTKDPSQPDDAPDADALLDNIEDPDHRLSARLWLALIDGTVPSERLREAWQIAHSIRAVYARMIQQACLDGDAEEREAAFNRGHAAGWQDATDAIARAERELIANWVGEEPCKTH